MDKDKEKDNNTYYRKVEKSIHLAPRVSPVIDIQCSTFGNPRIYQSRHQLFVSVSGRLICPVLYPHRYVYVLLRISPIMLSLTHEGMMCPNTHIFPPYPRSITSLLLPLPPGFFPMFPFIHALVLPHLFLTSQPIRSDHITSPRYLSISRPPTIQHRQIIHIRRLSDQLVHRRLNTQPGTQFLRDNA